MTKGNEEKRFIGTTDEPLSEYGRKMLEKTQYPQVERLFASPMLRTRQTAQIIYPDMKPILVDEFRECDFGNFENKNYEQLDGNEEYQAWIDSGGEMRFPGGELPSAFRERVNSAFYSVYKWAKDEYLKNIAIVAHGGTIMSILSEWGSEKRGFYDLMPENGECLMLEL